jgi:hypothetical protein
MKYQHRDFNRHFSSSTKKIYLSSVMGGMKEIFVYTIHNSKWDEEEFTKNEALCMLTTEKLIIARLSRAHI